MSDLKDRIVKVRDRIEELRQQADAIRQGDMHLPKAEAQADLAAWITEVSERGREALRRAASLASVDRLRFLDAPGEGRESTKDALALLVLGCEKELRKAADAAVADTYQGVTDTLPRADRQRLLNDLDRQLLELEQADEDLVQQALSQGLQVTRRPDADPRALLGVTHDFKRCAP